MDSKSNQVVYAPLTLNQQDDAEPVAVTAEVIGLPTVQVQAPSDLPAGYQLTVDINGEVTVVSVPAGGVQAGETFQGTVVGPDKSAAVDTSSPFNIPVGGWRDGIFDCCNHGCCHTSCCTAYWCPNLAVGQLMTRMGLDWTGSPVPTNRYATGWSPFKLMVALTVAYFAMYLFVNTIIQVYVEPTDAGAPPHIPGWIIFLLGLRSLLAFMFSVYVLFAMIRTRMYIRKKYAIREQYCSGCDDCCLSFWCSCCTVSQMDRHTADYRQLNASCCSETGLSQQAAHIV